MFLTMQDSTKIMKTFTSPVQVSRQTIVSQRRIYVHLFFLSFHDNLYNLHLRMGRGVSVHFTKNSLFHFFGWLYTIRLGFIYLSGLGVIRPTHMKFLLVNQSRLDLTLRLTRLHLNQQPGVSWLGTEVHEVKMRWRVTVEWSGGWYHI